MRYLCVGAAAVLLMPIACTKQVFEPVVAAAQQDPCLPHAPADCNADTVNGCYLQPNRTGCLTTDPTCAPGECRAGDPFVRRVGDTLGLHDKPYRFVGANQYGMAWNTCAPPGFSSQDAALARTFDDLVAMKVHTMRIYAFQSFAGAAGTDYATFDRAVKYARRAGVRLIFVLSGMQTDGCGGEADEAWFAGGYQQPYNGAALSFQDYVAGLVAHFRDEPAVLAWELVHEGTTTSFAVLDAFVADMSQRIKASDANHLVGPGTDSGTSTATSNSGGKASNYARLHSHAGVDFMDLHDFGTDPGLPASSTTDIAIAGLLGMPFFVGATGIAVADAKASSLAARAAVLEPKLADALDAGAMGFLIWNYLPNWTTPGFDFDSRPEEPLSGPNGVVASHAQENP